MSGLFGGCDNWLDVKPETEVNEDDMFSTEQGFMDALYGVYVNMGKSDVYGGTLQTAVDMTGQIILINRTVVLVIIKLLNMKNLDVWQLQTHYGCGCITV